MKRALKYFILAAGLAALLACLALPVWLLGTETGARFALEMISRHTDIKISATNIEGNLLGALRLENLEVGWPEGSARIEHLALTARPLDLSAGHLSFQKLSLRNVSIRDNAKDKPPSLRWPAVSGLLSFFSGKIEWMEIDNLAYRHLEKDPLTIQTISASIAWRKSLLSVSNLRVSSDLGVAEGNILAGFDRPLLEINLAARVTRPSAGMERFQLNGKFGPGKNRGDITGNLNLSGSRNQQTLWQMSADAGMTTEGFPLKNIRLYRPDRKGVITADGMLTLSGPLPYLEMNATASDFDLSEEFKIPANLSGSLTFAGTSQKYRGRFLINYPGKDWKAVRIAGDYSGNDQNLTLNATQGSALNGALRGLFHISRLNGLAINGTMSGRNLDPAVVDKNWQGVINFDLSGRVSIPEREPPSGSISGTLLQSRLHGQQLTGSLSATFVDNDVRVARLVLQGKGFQITASGAVGSKLDFTARITDLSRLIPQSAGEIKVQGWARWQSGRASGVISASGRGLTASGWEIATADLKAVLEDEETSPLSLNATFGKLRYQGFTADTLRVKATGSKAAHTLDASVRHGRQETHLSLSGIWHQGAWQGKIIRLNGADSIGPWKLVQPAAVSVTLDSLSLEPLTISGDESETLKISGKLSFDPLAGSMALNWNKLNLGRANDWTNPELLKGLSDGNISLTLLPQNHITLSGKVALSGTLQAEGQSVNIRQGEMTLDANEKGVRADVNLRLAQGGTLQGAFSSTSPASLALPDEGNVHLQWQEFDLTPLSVWLPGRVKLEGKIAGEAKGKLLPNRRFSLTGRAALTQSKMTWRGQKGDIGVALRDASLHWVWQEEALSGGIAMTMAEYGKLQGRFDLPIAARFPVSMDKRGSIKASLAGQFREKGALGVLFPGLVRESHGALDLDLKVSGSWAEPEASGNIHLSGVGGYLPTAGITLKDAQISARLDSNAIRIDSFRAVSGQGHVEGSALIRMKRWQVEGYEGRLQGERFQTIYFPELQVQTSPQLTFYGTPEKLSVRGEILLPAVSVMGSPSQGPIGASPDVIVAGKTKQDAKKLPVDLDVDVRLTMGDAVLFQAGGIDAQLGGRIDLQFQDPEKITGRGEIRVVKGRFRTYGVNLDIVRGRLFYAGGSLNRPALDILALRKIGDVQAGVAVSGSLPNPVVKLYSEPFMEDMDILAYIVLGHPLGSSSEQANLVATAAGALLTSRQSEEVLRQIKDRLGFDTFEISTDVVTQNGYMGYKRINVSPTGTGSTNAAGGIPETMLTVGKYLTPKLYISYGRSLFSGSNLFFLRYNLSDKWQVETQAGRESGVDIYYKLEFN